MRLKCFRISENIRKVQPKKMDKRLIMEEEKSPLRILERNVTHSFDTGYAILLKGGSTSKKMKVMSVKEDSFSNQSVSSSTVNKGRITDSHSFTSTQNNEEKSRITCSEDVEKSIDGGKLRVLQQPIIDQRVPNGTFRHLTKSDCPPKEIQREKNDVFRKSNAFSEKRFYSNVIPCRERSCIVPQTTVNMHISDRRDLPFKEEIRKEQNFLHSRNLTNLRENMCYFQGYRFERRDCNFRLPVQTLPVSMKISEIPSEEALVRPSSYDESFSSWLYPRNYFSRPEVNRIYSDGNRLIESSERTINFPYKNSFRLSLREQRKRDYINAFQTPEYFNPKRYRTEFEHPPPNSSITECMEKNDIEDSKDDCDIIDVVSLSPRSEKSNSEVLKNDILYSTTPPPTLSEIVHFQDNNNTKSLKLQLLKKHY